LIKKYQRQNEIERQNTVELKICFRGSSPVLPPLIVGIWASRLFFDVFFFLYMKYEPVQNYIKIIREKELLSFQVSEILGNSGKR